MLRSAVLLLWEKGSDQIPRVMTFDDHNDAYDSMKAFNKSGQYKACWMATFEHYEQGQKPADLPAVQGRMFDGI